MSRKANDTAPLVEKITALRKRALKHVDVKSKHSLDKPVSTWIKPERLLNEMGKEFNIILRTKGCSWALSETGGCTMCGYVQDANIEHVPGETIIQQVDNAIDKNSPILQEDTSNYVLKIFNSGSFFDDSEIDKATRMSIYERINSLKKVKEVVVESRVEYLTRETLDEIKQHLSGIHVEIGIGLETTSDHVRNNYVNKGLLYQDFITSVESCKEIGVGIKAYLLFKPPFLNEQAAIDDCSASIQELVRLGVNTISINPVNIQKGSLVEYLWYQNRYRPPWYYSLFKCLRKALKRVDFSKVRILSDPSGAGTKRGIHNCLRRECNENMRKILNSFVMTQDLTELEKIKKRRYSCDCSFEYLLKKQYE